ncbi:MAG TPA: NAD(P)-binding domain-containing protein [Streptosporangiaceae bacterium]
MDYLVIGAGPAGRQLGWFLERAGRDYLILEAEPPPRQPPSATRNRAAPVLKIRYRSRVTRVTREGDPPGGDGVQDGDGAAELDAAPGDARFVVFDQSGRVYRAKRVIVATGLGRPFLPPIRGIETVQRCEDVAANPGAFAGRRVLIIGKGDSAFETAATLAGRAAAVHVVGPRAVPARRITQLTGRRWAGNEMFADPWLRDAHDAVLDAAIRRIERGSGGEFVVTLSYARRAGRIRTVRIRYDRVVACTGFQMDSTIFDPSCRPEPALGGRLPALTSEWESVNVPDLYFAGALVHVHGRARPVGVFVHGLRYAMRALYRMLERKYEGVEWPNRELAAAADVLTAAVLTRISRSPGLFQRCALLCDLIVMAPRGARAWYYEEMPVAYVHDSLFGSADRYFTITLEYVDTPDVPDVPDALGQVDGADADAADAPPGDRRLQPVIRHYRRWALVAVQRLPEDMDGDRAGDAGHRTPLRAFFAQQMALALALTRVPGG